MRPGMQRPRRRRVSAVESSVVGCVYILNKSVLQCAHTPHIHKANMLYTQLQYAHKYIQ